MPTDKIICFVSFDGQTDREDALSYLLGPSFEGRLAETQASRSAINVVMIPPRPPYVPPTDPVATSGGAAPYDAVVELWLQPDHVRHAYRSVCEALLPKNWTTHAYAVEETLVFERNGIAPGRPSAGVKFMGRLEFHEDLPVSAMRRSWSLHGRLAKKVHVGCDRYLQNLVTDRLDPACPPAHGIPVLQFPSENDLLTRFFDSDGGRDQIVQDTAHFVKSGPRLYAREYVSCLR